MMAAAATGGGLGIAGGVAGTAQAALPGAWGFALVQTPSGTAVAGPGRKRAVPAASAVPPGGRRAGPAADARPGEWRVRLPVPARFL
jgi:hypothetical protein